MKTIVYQNGTELFTFESSEEFLTGVSTDLFDHEKPSIKAKNDSNLFVITQIKAMIIKDDVCKIYL